MKTLRALASLNPYFMRYKRHLLLGVLFVFASNLFQVFQPSFVRDAINQAGELVPQIRNHVAGADQQLTSVALKAMGFLLLLTLIRGIFLFFTRQTLIVMSHHIVNDLRNDIFHHLQKLTLSFYRRNRTGDLMARITEDINRVRMYLGPGVMYNLNTLTTVVTVVIMMLMVSPELTLWSLLPLPVLSFMIWYVESIVNERSDRIQEQLSELSSFTQETFSGIRLIKAYVREQAMNEKMDAASDDYKRRSLRLAWLDSLFSPMVMALVGLSNVLVIWIGSIKVVDGELTIGNIAEFLMYVNMLTWPIISLGWVTTLIQRAAASQERINVLMKEKPEITFPESGPSVSRARVEFSHVSFRYPETGIQALEDVSFQLNPGEKLGILGSTGSGKTTLCNLIPRLMDPDSGEIRIDGVDVRQLTRDTLRGFVGYSPQDVFLFSDSLKENIAFGKPGAQYEEVVQAARDAAVYENIMSFPQAFETIIGERGVTLSGGQKQRVAIARARVRRPKLLILDDSLSAVDTGTEEEILHNLRKERQENPEMAVIMVSHRISTLQDSDRIIVLAKGRVMEQGTHAELIASNGYYASTWRKQLLEQQLRQDEELPA